MDKEEVLKILYGNKRRIPRQTYRTIRGQVLAGDIQGAYKGLRNTLEAKDGAEETKHQEWRKHGL